MTDIVKPTDIDALPPEPLPTDPPAEFNTKAFNLVAALKNLVNQTNTATANVWNNSKAAHERAVTAGASASDAAGSSGLASSRAVEAAASAEQASGYASTAATAAGNANASWSQMQKLYLGIKSTPPTTDNQGQPLQDGAWYTNETNDFWYWWKGGAWKIGVGDLSSVDYTTQVVNKPQTLAAVGIADMTAARNELSAPSKTGGGASGTWPISISGNAATATSATTAGSATTANGASAGWTSAAVNANTSSDGNTAMTVRNNSGSGDTGLAAFALLCQGAYGIKVKLRADGYFGIGGWSRTAWSWYSDPSGNMTASGNVTAYSDPRLKDDVTTIEDALAIIERLDGVRFTWNNKTKLIGRPGKRDIGLLADQVEDVLPELVSLSIPDADNDGEQWRTVAYDKLGPVLVQAVKQLSARVKQLESEQ
ncbi:tail fiber domain-containing protein [Diaphorobacter ruginosibacter]|uniref:Tail fiber domain-containing protein n=1 Tax=Diaphorobacter ruginosibacter TaxID=1715720 RepID=A0A7G9RLL5_9BURK|nr:tail fiber domain-containing protein [Diaphorobacter ruginosibacter]QNN56490.1 tail fiber domain-containing protein [Diaphorobacter ruginosibacter]